MKISEVERFQMKGRVGSDCVIDINTHKSTTRIVRIVMNLMRSFEKKHTKEGGTNIEPSLL